MSVLLIFGGGRGIFKKIDLLTQVIDVAAVQPNVSGEEDVQQDRPGGVDDHHRTGAEQSGHAHRLRRRPVRPPPS